MSLSEIRSICDEIATVATSIARVQDRLVNLARQTEQQHESWHHTLEEVQRTSHEVVNSAKWLSHQNHELERRLAQQKPSLDNAIDARDAAFQKLHSARKVIRDLVNDNVRLQVARGLLSTLTEDEEREELKRALEEAMPVSVSSSNSDSNRTVRQHQSPLPAPSPRIDSSRRPAEVSEPGSASSHQVSSPTTSSAESVHPASSQFADTDDMGRYNWNIHYSNPPASSEMSLGPVDYSRLLQHAMIAKETVGSLKRLQSSTEPCLRLHTLNDLAFLYDPIFLEARSGDIKMSYILDWGTEGVNQSLETFIGSNRTPLHTFVFPMNKKKWYYVGALTWRVAELWSIWPSLSTKSKRKLVGKLVERNHREHDEETITSALNNGKLRQLCVEISSNGHWERSTNFAQKMGYEAPRDRV